MLLIVVEEISEESIVILAKIKIMMMDDHDSGIHWEVTGSGGYAATLLASAQPSHRDLPLPDQLFCQCL